MFVTTDAKGNPKMFPLRTRAKQHDDEVGSSANSNLQPLQPQHPLPQAEVPSPPPRPPQAKPMVPRRIIPHPDTSHSLVSPVAHPLAGHVRNASNTLPEPRVPTVPTVPVVSTSVLPRETPTSLLTDTPTHPPSHLVSSLPAREPAPCRASPVGSIIAPLPRYTASHNHLESWNVGFTDMELESEAQLLNALPVPIRRHPAQSYAFGTGVVDTHSQTDTGQGAPIQIQYPQQATPVYSEYSFVHDSTYTYTSVPVQPHRYHQHKPAPAPAPAPVPLSMESYPHAEIPQSRYYHLGAQQPIQLAVRQTQAIQDSYQHQHQHCQHQGQRYQQPSFHSHGSYQGLYISQYAHGPYISEYYDPYV